MPFQKYQSAARRDSNATHYVIVRRRVVKGSGEKSEARSFSISSEKDTQEILDEIRGLVCNGGGGQ